RRRHTSFSRDWSSDVCSSDLYAMIGAALGLKVELCLPENASLERKRTIQAYGTKIHFTDPLEGSEGARVVAAEMYRANPDRYFKIGRASCRERGERWVIDGTV